MTQANPLLAVEHLSKRYDVESPPVLENICLSLSAGEAIAVVGPSGSGKSTLLNILGLLDRPSGGSVRMDGRDMAGLSDRQAAAVRNRDIGFVFQLHHLLPQCTVMENVLVPTLPAGAEQRQQAPERARRLLERVGLGQRLNDRPGRLSGGERQRVAVVRALINRPALLLADEPTGSLDRASADNLSELLTDLNAEENVALVVVTHSLRVARRMQRVLTLREGGLWTHDPQDDADCPGSAPSAAAR